MENNFTVAGSLLHMEPKRLYEITYDIIFESRNNTLSYIFIQTFRNWVQPSSGDEDEKKLDKQTQFLYCLHSKLFCCSA
jgi:hypothetical protein